MQRKKDKLMLNIAKIGHTIYQAVDSSIKNEKPQLVVTTALSCLFVLLILNIMWPIKGIGSWLITFSLIVLSLAISVFISKYLLVMLLIVIAEKTLPFSISYKEKINGINNGEKGEKEKSQGLGTGPTAEVNIKYFLEKEKKMKLYNAKYVGPI